MPFRTTTTREPVGAGLFGVHFMFRNGDLDLMGQGLAAFTERLGEVREVTADAIAREKRPAVTYWDGLTFMESRNRPQRLSPATVQNTKLLLNALRAWAAGRDNDAAIKTLANDSIFSGVRTRLKHHSGHTPRIDEDAIARSDPGLIELGADGHRRLRPGGFYRLFELPLECTGPMTDAEWDRLFVLALLINLRADLEIYYETGFRRLRRCARRACRAWFGARPMGGKQRFCCDVCRALDHRESKSRDASM